MFSLQENSDESGTPRLVKDCPYGTKKCQKKRRTRARVEWDEEEKGNDQGNGDDASPPVCWHASVNAVEVNDLSEPATFQEAVGGPDQTSLS